MCVDLFEDYPASSKVLEVMKYNFRAPCTDFYFPHLVEKGFGIIDKQMIFISELFYSRSFEQNVGKEY